MIPANFTILIPAIISILQGALGGSATRQLPKF
jgi:hypothetical protein